MKSSLNETNKVCALLIAASKALLRKCAVSGRRINHAEFEQRNMLCQTCKRARASNKTLVSANEGVIPFNS